MIAINEVMANIYLELIKKGVKTIDGVPENLRENVEKLLSGN